VIHFITDHATIILSATCILSGTPSKTADSAVDFAYQIGGRLEKLHFIKFLNCRSLFKFYFFDYNSLQPSSSLQQNHNTESSNFFLGLTTPQHQPSAAQERFQLQRHISFIAKNYYSSSYLFFISIQHRVQEHN
jgi:hypothetical protein